MDSEHLDRTDFTSLKIGQLSKLADLPVATLRFYEGQGVLRPKARTGSGYRLYGEEALRRLHFVSRARSLGMSLRSIAAILEVAESARPPCEHVSTLVLEQLDHVDEKLARLTALRGELIQLRDRLADASRYSSDDYEICPCIERVPRAD